MQGKKTAIAGAAVDATGAESTDTGIPTIDIAAQYDGFADFPQYPINLLADLNALFGIIYAHAPGVGAARKNK